MCLLCVVTDHSFSLRTGPRREHPARSASVLPLMDVWVVSGVLRSRAAECLANVYAQVFVRTYVSPSS